MSLLLDALKKAADDKKASQVDAPVSDKADQPHADSASTQQGRAVDEHDAVDPAPEELTLEPAGQAEPLEHPALELTLDEEPELTSRQEPDRDSSQSAAESIAESAEGTMAHQPSTDPAPSVSLPIEQSGRQHTVSDEALNLLIYNTNRDIRRNRVLTIVGIALLSLLVLVSGGYYFYTDMQTEIADLERSHRTAMLAMQGKTGADDAPRPSAIIRNLVSDRDLSEKVEFAREQMSAPAADSAPSRKASAPIGPAAADHTDDRRLTATERPATGTAAVMSISRSRSVDPVELQLEQAWDAYDAGDHESSLQIYRAVLDSEPENRDALLGVGANAVVTGDLASAIDSYGRLLEIDPTDPIASAALSELQVGEANNAELERYLLRTLEKNPQSAALNFAMGNYYARQDEWRSAQDYYFRAWQQESMNADYVFNLAVSMDQLDKPEQAVALYRDSLALAKQGKVSFSPDAVSKRIRDLAEQ